MSHQGDSNTQKDNGRADNETPESNRLAFLVDQLAHFGHFVTRGLRRDTHIVIIVIDRQSIVVCFLVFVSASSSHCHGAALLMGKLSKVVERGLAFLIHTKISAVTNMPVSLCWVCLGQLASSVLPYYLLRLTVREVAMQSLKVLPQKLCILICSIHFLTTCN